MSERPIRSGGVRWATRYSWLSQKERFILVGAVHSPTLWKFSHGKGQRSLDTTSDTIRVMAMTLRLSNELDQRLDDFARLTGMSKQKIVEKSLDEFLERAHHTTAVEEARNKILTRDKELFDRLADA
jgi:predicted DNA-binding protein